MHLDRETTKKIKGLIWFTVLTLVALWNYKVLFRGICFLWRVLLPFVVGCAIAFILNVPMRFFERKLFGRVGKRAREMSLLLTILIGAGIVVAVLFFAVPELGKTVAHLGENMDALLPKLQQKLVQALSAEPKLARWVAALDVSWETLSGYAMRFLRNGAGDFYDFGLQTVRSIVSGFTAFTIAFVFACYLLLQKERIGVQVKKTMYAFMPRDWTEILLAFSSLSEDVFSRFLSGQCLEALILGAMFLVTLLILRIPYALLISVVITITALIPIFGAFVGCAVGVLLIFTEAPMKALLFLVVFFVLQEVEGDFVYPRVVGRYVGLPSIWVLFAVSVGAGLMGIVGMVLFIPISSVVYSMLKGIVHRRLKERGIEM